MRYLLCFLACLCVGPLTGASLALLDGTVLEGEVQLSEGGVAIAGQTIAYQNADWISLSENQSPERDADHTGLLLSDGSWLPYSTLRSNGSLLVAETPVGTVELEIGTVVGWGPADWVALQNGEGKDQLKLLNGAVSGEVLDLADGTLQVQTALDPEPLPVALNQVEACRLALPAEPVKGLHLASRLAVGHPSLALVPHAQGLALAAAPKKPIVTTALPTATVRGGRRVYLSDISVAAAKEAGAFGVVWPHKLDADLDGGPLLLGGIRYDRGVSIHSQAELKWIIGGKYERFRALVGIADLVGQEGDCAMRILVDGEERWARASLRGGNPAQAVDIDVSGGKELTVIVDYGARYDIGDHVTLADAWLLKK